MNIKPVKDADSLTDSFKLPSSKPYNLSIFSRLVICFLLLSIVPMIIFGYYSISNSRNTVHEKTNVLFEQLSEKGAELLSQKLDALVKATDQLKTNQTMLNSLTGERTPDAQIEMALRIMKSSNPDMYGVAFIKPDGDFAGVNIDDELLQMLNSPEYSYSELYAVTKGKANDVAWLDTVDSDYREYMVRYLHDYLNARPIGILVISVHTSVFDTMFTGFDNFESILIVNDAGTVQYSTRRHDSGNSVKDVTGLSIDDIPEEECVASGDNIIVARTLGNDWRLVFVASNAEVMKEIDGIRSSHMVLCVFLIALTIVVSLHLSGSITNPILYLLSLMRKVGGGDINVESAITGRNEIAGLSEGFNSMVENIRKLMAQNEKGFNELESAYKAISEANDENYQLAFTDPLTGLPNRRAYIEEMNKLFSEMDGDGFVALLYVDIDDFKKINDSVGHATGDYVLTEIKERLFSVTMDEDCFIARLSGDEFLIILRRVRKLTDIENIVSGILNSFKIPFVVDGKEYYLSASIGVAVAPDDAANSLDLLTNADAAMYKAKSLGKNRFTFFNVAVREQAIKDMKIERELRRAIANENFMLYYQPQIDLETNRICGFEALIRWDDPKNGIRMPGEFIGVAERTGLIVKIGEWVVRQACRQAKEWNDMGCKGYTVAVNLSARQFRDKEIFDVISGALHDTGLDPRMLDLELTESIAIDNIDYTLETMNDIKRLGVAFSLDDFGTGYSSMNYLKYLPFDNLKIDKSYVDNIADNVSEQEIIKALIALAHALDMKVIAEGIETQAQSDMISRFNCDSGQGYLYGRPLKAEDAGKLLQKFSQ